MLSALFTAIAAAPALVFGGLIVFVLMRYWGTDRKGPSPVRVDPGQAAKLFDAALAGNKPMVIEALRKAFELDIGTGKLPAIISEWALFEVEQRVKDPARPAYVIEAVAKFTGLTQEEVLAIVKEDFTVKPAPVVLPAPSPVVAVAAVLLLFFLPSVGVAASPVSTWGMPVTGPQRFYEKASPLKVDPPLMRDAKGQLVPLGDCNLPDRGPNVYINYFYASWCNDCAASTQVCNDLIRKGWRVIKRDAGSNDGAGMARAFGVTSVPFWVIHEDGREAVRTNDHAKVLEYLSNHKPQSYQVSVYSSLSVQPPEGSYYQAAYYRQQQQSFGWWDRGIARRIVSAPFRWRPIRRLFGRC